MIKCRYAGIAAGIAVGVLALAVAVGPIEAQAPVRVPRSVLERYVGTYEFIPGQMKRTDSMRLAKAVSIALAVAASAAPFIACAQTSAVTPPGTPAGTIADAPEAKRLKELLAVVNSGDAAAMRSYLQRNSVDPRTNRGWSSMLLPMVHELYRLSTGLDLVRITTIGRQQRFAFTPARSPNLARPTTATGSR